MERECQVYLEHVESLLTDLSPLLAAHVPFPSRASAEETLLHGLRDGVVLSFLINSLQPDAVQVQRLHYQIDLAQMGKQYSKALYEVGENLNACLQGAKKLSSQGIVVVNIGSNDVLNMKPDLVLGLVWQLVRGHMMRHINLVARPALIRLMEPNETLRDLIHVKAEHLLLRWFNFHLKRAEESPILNWNADLCDGVKYIHLLDQISPATMDRTLLEQAASCTDPLERARVLLEHVKRMGCRRYVTPKDIVNGHARLNQVFTAELFNHFIGIHLPSDLEIRDLMQSKEVLQAENAALHQRLAEYEAQLSEQVARWQREQHDLSSKFEHTVAESAATQEELVRSHQQAMQQREMEMTNRLESMKAHHRQQVHQLEHTLETERRQWKQETELTADILRDFLARQKAERMAAADLVAPRRRASSSATSKRSMMMAQPASLSNRGIDTEEDNPQKQGVRDLVMDVLALHEEMSREMEFKVKRLEHVNELIGDKVQEYAEGLIHGGKKKSSRKLFGFGNSQ